FLAVNSKVVYATDRSRRLLMLDRARGTQLNSLDTRDFVVPIANELTDRIYLAANNGLFMCLHDRDNTKPQHNRKVERQEPEKKRGEKMKEKDKPKSKSEDQEPADAKEKGDDSDKKPEKQ